MRRSLVPIVGLLALAACSSSSKSTANGGAPVLPSNPGGTSSAPAPTSAPSTSTTAPTAATVPASASPGDAPTSASAPSASPSASGASASPSASAPPSASASATGSSSPAGTPRCHTSQLAYKVGGGQGAAGTLIQDVVLTNTSAMQCTLAGYPGLQLVDSAKRFLPTTVTRGGGDTQDPGPSLVTLKPGGTASFAMSFGSCQEESTCEMSTYLEVTPPDERDYLFNPAMLSVNKGGIHVSAVVAGGNGPG